MNTLYFGDNLDWLPKIGSESVDLVYLDPPFNSEATYNILYRSPSNEDGAQFQAFADSWRWGPEADRSLAVVRASPSPAFGLLTALNNVMQKSDLMAYLTMMTARLLELHRVLKHTGTLYLHCDPTAGHYIKILMDAIFDSRNFLSEVVWKRTGSHSSARRWGPVHDLIFVYAKSNGDHIWNRPYVPLSTKHLETHYRKVDSDGRRYEHGELTGAGTRNGRSGMPWRGFDVASIGRHWTTTIDKLDELFEAGRIYLPKDGGWPRLIRFADDSKGRAVGDIWDDIPPINMRAVERLGYPTQKPLALLERIISASSHPGDVILDPFCGCGTAIEAAQKLGRQWIGIDVTVLAIDVVEARLARMKLRNRVHYSVEGIPKDIDGARRLFEEDPHDFQMWALTLVDAQPRDGGRRGADRGVDGLVFYREDSTRDGYAIVSVKGGKNVHADQIRDLLGTMSSQGAKLGLFVTLAEPTSAMVRAAREAGSEEILNRHRSKIQILTIEELLLGKKPDLPPVYDIISASAAARRSAARKPPKLPSPEDIRQQPSLRYTIPGGREDAVQETMDLDEPLLSQTTEAIGPRKPRKRG